MRYCARCGADLAATKVVAGQAFEFSAQVSEGSHLSPEILVPRIGEYMIEQGVLQADGLQQALDYQKERAAEGESILLGQAMLALGLVSRETLDQVVTMQILKLQRALSDANNNLQQRVEERTRELQRAMERLAELNHLKSNFISTISHELRTPLTHIKGYLDLLMEGGLGQLNQAQVDVVEVLKRAEARLEQLIEDLIQFSLASRGELTLTPQPTDLGQLIRITVDRLNLKLKEKEIDLRIAVPTDLPAVKADREKIGWVLLQLMDNAVKFTPKGGRVQVQAVANRTTVSVAVIDSGIGIPAERTEEIFEPFHQLDGSTTRRYPGAGLGLAMARQIIEAHGSAIEVQSVVNQGSRFMFVLPVAMDYHAISTDSQ
jgi:signal transduction histidine kinase